MLEMRECKGEIVTPEDFSEDIKMELLVGSEPHYRKLVIQTACELIEAVDGGDEKWRHLSREQRIHAHKVRLRRVKSEGMNFPKKAFYIGGGGPPPSTWALWKLLSYIQEWDESDTLETVIGDLYVEEEMDKQ